MKPTQPKYEVFTIGFQRIELLEKRKTSYIYVLAAIISVPDYTKQFKKQMDWRFNTIWFEQINQTKFHQQDFKTKYKSADNFAKAEYAILWHFKQSGLSFDSLTPSDKLLYLELNWANILNLLAIERFENLKRLELHYCTKLESDIGIETLKNTIEFLHINQSKKFTFTKNLLELKKLKVLRLNSCAPIDNLKFLKNFPNLIDFRFVNTNVIDGDLTPIIKHPTIRTVGLSNKRHYNFTDSQLENELNLKSTVEYKDYVYKGQYQTFRYNYE